MNIEEEGWNLFLQRHSAYMDQWTEMNIQQFTITNIVREAIGYLSPLYLAFNSNSIYICDSVDKSINESRSGLRSQFIKADITVELNFKNINKKLIRSEPYYFITVQVQKEQFSEVRLHKDYRKVCFAMRCMLNDSIRAFTPEDNCLTCYGILAGPNGAALLALTAQGGSYNNTDFIYFRLQESRIGIY